MYLHEVPRRLGQCQALDDACACLIGAHSSLVKGSHEDGPINLSSYRKALRSLQDALHTREAGFSTNVLAATAIMYFIEVSTPLLITSISSLLILLCADNLWN